MNSPHAHANPGPERPTPSGTDLQPAAAPPAGTPGRRHWLRRFTRLAGAAATGTGTGWRPGAGPGLGLMLGLLATAPAPAWALAQPKGRVLLSITGRIGASNAPRRADFDMAMLDALPQHTFSTHTPWFNQARRFSGPLLRDVLALVAADGQQLQAIALNDYKVEIPMEDTRRYPMLLSTRLDGRPMAVRDKGPLFVIYPFDDHAELRSERYYSRSAWQLRRLDVR